MQEKWGGDFYFAGCRRSRQASYLGLTGSLDGGIRVGVMWLAGFVCLYSYACHCMYIQCFFLRSFLFLWFDTCLGIRGMYLTRWVLAGLEVTETYCIGVMGERFRGVSGKICILMGDQTLQYLDF